jgi:sodium/bile acid cotransporter 3/5
MTTISTIIAFLNIPLWLFTLGKPLFNKANIGVPYYRLAIFAALLIIPILIGAVAQKFYPRLTKISAEYLKTVGTGLIIFIIIFAIYNNLYLFAEFSWSVRKNNISCHG